MCGNGTVCGVCVVDSDGVMCVGVCSCVVVRVFVVDDDGGDVAVRYILTSVVVGGALDRPANVCGCAWV